MPVLTVGLGNDLAISASETDALPLSLFLREGSVRIDGEGRIALPSGRTYAVLRVPRTGGLHPSQTHAVAARTLELIRDGATVWGDFTPSPGAKGRVFAASKSRSEVLAAVGVRPAVEIAAKNLDALTAERYLLAGAREADEARFFFLANGHTNAVAFAATFDAGARVPEIWNPETGAMQEAPLWRVLPDGRTQVDLEMEPCDSLFTVFRCATQERGGSSRPPQPFTVCREIVGPWRVRFEPADLAYGDTASLPDWGWIQKAKPGRGVTRFPDWLLNGTMRPSRGRIAIPFWDYYADAELPPEVLALSPSGLLGPVRLSSRPCGNPAD